ncbi:response regulator [Magnetospira sp. QH-2]|uniref:response regulator n=1 Tax=Magnetospira sp. (strain QH-2) TaxID=1288970 RepID=UPI0003E80D51|nr:response regulator [Magnetospira sp. QH-2]CCQ74310.1 Response regulator rcp1 [Magnetospira sp. QH-2]
MSEAQGNLTKNVHILLVEDNLGDARLVEEVLKEGAYPHSVSHVRDGVEAMEFLREGSLGEEGSLPDVIFLDLNMPRMDGREVLSEIKGDPLLRSIPVIVLTTSTSEADIVTSYSLNANCYVTKPVSIDAFLDVMQTLENFWFGMAALPLRSDGGDETVPS